MQTDRESFRDAVRAAQSGDAEAERLLIEQNLPLVTAIAKRYTDRGIEFDDLRQLGSIGLLKAVRRFDDSFGVCFSTYAVPLIAGEIKRFLRDDGMIKFSRSAKQLACAVSLALREEPDLTVDALAERLHVNREDLAVAAASASAVASLDEPFPDGSGERAERFGIQSERSPGTALSDGLVVDAAILLSSERLPLRRSPSLCTSTEPPDIRFDKLAT